MFSEPYIGIRSGSIVTKAVDPWAGDGNQFRRSRGIDHDATFAALGSTRNSPVDRVPRRPSRVATVDA